MSCYGSYAVGEQEPSALGKHMLKSCLLIKKNYHFLSTYCVPGIVKVFTDIISFHTDNSLR